MSNCVDADTDLPGAGLATNSQQFNSVGKKTIETQEMRMWNETLIGNDMVYSSEVENSLKHFSPLAMLTSILVVVLSVSVFAQDAQEESGDNSSVNTRASANVVNANVHAIDDGMGVSVRHTGEPQPSPVQLKKTKYEVIHLRGQNQDPDYFEREVERSLERDHRRRETTQVVDSNNRFIASKVSRRSGAPSTPNSSRAPAGIAPSSAVEVSRKEKEAMRPQVAPTKGKRRLAKSQ